MQACFIGHRSIEENEQLISTLKSTIITLIHKGVNIFLFGSKSDFDKLAWKVVTQLKSVFPFIKRVYVRSSYQFIDQFYKKYLLESYEETYFPQKIKNAGKASYVERNFAMIDCSLYCVFYYDEKYKPIATRKSKRNIFLPTKQISGTKIAYEYAVKKKKKIINVFNC